VAYASLLQTQRRVLHARIVESLERLYPDRLAEQVERLAHHALRGEVWDKAVSYCQQAGARAYNRTAFREAVACYEQALQALQQLPTNPDRLAQAIDLRLALASALAPLGEYGGLLARMEEAEALARALDDQTRLGWALVRMAPTLRMQPDLNRGMAVCQQALAIAITLGDRLLHAAASHRLALAYYAKGDYSQAAALLRHNVEVLAPGPHLYITSRAWLGLVLSRLGVFAEGRHYGEEALRLAMGDNDGQTLIIAYGCLSYLYLSQGELEHAVQGCIRGLALCRTHDSRDWSQGFAAGLGYAYALTGRLTEGRTLLEAALRESSHIGALFAHSLYVVWLSEVCCLVGCLDEARAYAYQALALARRHVAHGREAVALQQLGVIHAHAEAADTMQAEAYYRQALALAEELGMRPLQAHCHFGLGTLYNQTGQMECARAALSTAIDLYRTMDMTFWLPQAEAALAQVEGR
jgi:tetratricopeptide (TPR) repeat protein